MVSGMNEQATRTKVGTSVSQLRCIGCGRTALPDRFRCEHCRDLLEIIYPGWDDRGPGGLSASSLKELWRDRRSSLDPVDQSGVWRFREILPDIPQPQIITIKEGQYSGLRTAAVRPNCWYRPAFCQASGNESDRIVQRHGYDSGGVVRAAGRISLGSLRFDGKYLRVDGSLCGTRRPA